MKNWSKVLGGSGHPPAPIEKDRHALPEPVNPYPRPEEPVGLPFGSGSVKQMQKNRQAEFDRKNAEAASEAANLKREDFLAGLSGLAHSIAKKLGVTLAAPIRETSFRQVGRNPAGIASQRLVGFVTPQLIMDCAKTTKNQLATPEELTALRTLAARWVEGHALMERLAPSGDRVRVLMAQDAAKVGTPDFVGLDVDGVRQRCIAEMRPIKWELQAISKEAADIATSIRSRALEAISNSLGQALESEIKLAEKQRMPFVPSVYASTLTKLQEALGAQDLTSPGQCSPRDFLIGLLGMLLDETKEEKTK